MIKILKVFTTRLRRYRNSKIYRVCDDKDLTPFLDNLCHLRGNVPIPHWLMFNFLEENYKKLRRKKI